MDNYTGNLLFSVFYDENKGIKNTTPKKAKDLNGLKQIYQSARLEELTNHLKNSQGEQRQLIKLQLPFFTPYGTFKQRNNASIEHYNQNLIALDFDGLDIYQAQTLKAMLCQKPSTVLCAISPRQNGVKALLLVNSEATPTNHYNTLKHNAKPLLAHLKLDKFSECLDLAQFVLCQPMFFAFDLHLYINEYATPSYTLKEYTPPQMERLEWTRTAPNYRCNRIEQYLLNASDKLTRELINKPEGQRHHSIIKVQKIASWIHYANHLEDTIKAQLRNAVITMYGNERNANNNNALTSFKLAWNSATATANPTIETIINDYKRFEQYAKS